MRVVVPAACHSHILQDLHQEHGGMTCMKSVACSYVWWPNLDSELEALMKAISQGSPNSGSSPSLGLAIHVDYAGPFQGQMFLVVVDAHSKWPDVQVVSTATTEKTVTVLRDLFARFGLPEQLVSDNGSQFVSAEFEEFLIRVGAYAICALSSHFKWSS